MLSTKHVLCGLWCGEGEYSQQAGSLADYVALPTDSALGTGTIVTSAMDFL